MVCSWIYTSRRRCKDYVAVALRICHLVPQEKAFGRIDVDKVENQADCVLDSVIGNLLKLHLQKYMFSLFDLRT